MTPPPLRSLLLALSLVCTSALAQTQYDVKLLKSSEAEKLGPNSLNNAGQVVGSVVDDISHSRAFFTAAKGKSVTIVGTAGVTNSVAYSINDAGLFTGGIDKKGAFVQDSATGSVQDLGPLVGTMSSGRVITNTGLVAGTSRENDRNEVFVLDLNTRAVSRLPHNSADFPIEPKDLTEDGVVVGYGTVHTPADFKDVYHAFMSEPPYAVLTDLHNPALGRASMAMGLNQQQQVVGSYQRSAWGQDRPFIRNPGTPMRDLAIPKASHGRALDINDAGWVVGDYTRASGGYGGFIIKSDGTQFKDLDDVVTMPDGLTVHAAYKITNSGKILVQGSDTKYYLLTPVN
ncbi:hypothetical protein [Ideonella sp.]|nr:hypothetical protein [Ideonella sp.]